MTGTTTANVENPEVKLGKKIHKRKKKKMSKINITENLIKVVSESQKDILALSVLKLQGNLTEETLKAQLGDVVSEVEADLQEAVEADEEKTELEVNWAEVLESLEANDSKYTVLFEKVRGVLENVEGVEEVTVTESVELFATALSHSANEIFEGFDAAVEEESDARLEALAEEQEAAIEKQYAEATQEWIADKKELIEAGEKAVKVDSLYEGLKDLCVEHNVSMDDEANTKLTSLEESIADLTAKLEEATNEVASLKGNVVEAAKESVLATVSESLSDVDKNKLRELAESVVFIDEEHYSKKLTGLKESFIDAKPKASAEEPAPVVENNEDEQDENSFNSFFATFKN